MNNISIIREYKLYLQDNNRSPKTIHGYEAILAELSDFMKSKPFKKMTAKDMSKFLRWKRSRKIVGGRHHKISGASLSEDSYWLYVLSLKIFYRWLYKLPQHHYPPQVAQLNVRRKKNQAITPSEIITKEDIATVLKHCSNFKEKAVISCLYESGCRATEFLDWRIGDIVFDKRGAVLNVKGKTGERRIRLIESVPHLQQWLETHPNRDEKRAYVWRRNQTQITQTAYMYLREMLLRLFKKAEIDKPVNPHAFRHSRLTELAKYLSDSKLKVFAGWTGSSRMAGTYVHLSGADLDEDLLKAAGVEISEKEHASPLMLRKCPRCGFQNSGSKFCSKCGLPLHPEELISKELEMKEELSHLQERFRLTELAMEQFAKETAKRMQHLESVINKYEKMEIEKQNEELLEEYETNYASAQRVNHKSKPKNNKKS
ncbi:tyrosine-type recombinase/integrase [Candidatus Bathyarchaeota archaeon]|nr:tyrosine-type recombinase/integrase [Candidatus Bathyarchaeota archaeon]